MPHRTPLSQEVRTVLKRLLYTLLILLVSVSGYYFLEMSSTAEKGYAFKENQVRQNTLEAENRTLKQQLLEVQSINNLKSTDVVKGMEAPVSETYVEPLRPISKRK